MNYDGCHLTRNKKNMYGWGWIGKDLWVLNEVCSNSCTLQLTVSNKGDIFGMVFSNSVTQVETITLMVL
jgi:hypothetical protein